MSFSSLGSLIQTSHSLDNSDSVRRNANSTDNLSKDIIFHSVSGSDSAEGSGHSVDSRTSQINKTVIQKDSEQASIENSSESGVTLTTTAALTPYHLQAHDQKADEANTSITGHTHSSVHLISEEALLDGSHITTEEQLQESQTSIVNDVLLNDGERPELPVQTNVFTSVKNQNMSSVPQWVPSQRIERRAKRVTAVCAFLGVLCCSLHGYSLLWLYGLLGNWRRFGWGWWLSQFWARILELAWGFSLLVLGSWIFWMPSRSHSRGDQWQSRSEASKGVDEKSLWGRVLASLRKGPLRKSEKTWEDLMPNNWAKYNLSRAGISNNVMCPYDDQPSTITPEYKPEPVSNSSSDSQAALLWQKVGERECILSLIEFDLRPPSPINLRRSIDYALDRGQLVAGGLFTPPALSWTHTVGSDTADGDGGSTLPSAYVGFGWMLDTESLSASLEHFQAKEPIQSSGATTDYTGSIGSPSIVQHGEEFNSMFSTVMFQHDWSDDDVTDL
ncbi:uncharacterized protein LOC113153424 [Anabas testudineus]|uniref:uncharacterized protein LOC113153424 n=1 Tax=Anabas testudineus TaxID=64144 RepID=UPI000E46625A|nr:uncharacterized protein LOC113153424 [Anabas testudineus]